MASSSAAAALKQACLVAAVCLVLVHSSLGHHPHPLRARPQPAASNCHYTGQKSPAPKLQPPPPPTQVPVPPPRAPPPPPTPTLPAPAPAPAPVNCTRSYCASYCSPICEDDRAAGAARCESDPEYQRCMYYNDRSVMYCLSSCQDVCLKNCSQQGA